MRGLEQPCSLPTACYAAHPTNDGDAAHAMSMAKSMANTMPLPCCLWLTNADATCRAPMYPGGRCCGTHACRYSEVIAATESQSRTIDIMLALLAVAAVAVAVMVLEPMLVPAMVGTA